MKISAEGLAAMADTRGEMFARALRGAGIEVGQMIEVPEETWRELQKKYPARAAAPGLGDLVASVATPIARALHLSCIDPATNQLRPESGCAKRKAALNQIRLP